MPEFSQSIEVDVEVDLFCYKENIYEGSNESIAPQAVKLLYLSNQNRDQQDISGRG